MKNDANDPLARVTAKPDLTVLHHEFQRAGVTTGWRGDAATNVRLMRWDGQTADGRKRAKARNQDVFPWDGAFDTRVPTVDLIVVTLLAVLKVAFNRAKLECVATEAKDIESAAKIQQVVEYYRKQMRRSLSDEMELALNAALTHGAVMLETGWERKLGTTRAAMTIEEVLGVAAQADVESPLAALPAFLGDPEAEEAAIDLILVLVPDLTTRSAARRFVRALREEGVAEYRRVFVAANRPTVRALRFGLDVFVPPETTDIQRARVVFVRDFMTEVEVLQRVQTEGWNKDWASAAVKTQGAVSTWATEDREGPDQKFLDLTWTASDTESHLIEVVYAYQQQLDDQDIPIVTCTVFCPHVTEANNSGVPAYGKHGPADFAHQELPFTVYQFERLNRRVMTSRGVPEIAYTWQMEEKTQCDMLADLASISVNPPRRTANARGQKYEWGPGAQTVGRQGELETFPTNASNAGLAFQIVEMIRRRRSEYFGIMDELVPAPLWQNRLAHLVDNWLTSCESMWKQITALVLDEANVSTEELQRITGVSLDGVDRSPEAIARGYDWALRFDARDLDMDFTLKKLESVTQMAVPIDREGRLSFARLLDLILSQIDPSFSGVLMTDPQEASDKIRASVDAEFVRMAAGNEANYVENDPTAPLKLQVAQDIVGSNPKYMQAYRTDERFREVVDNYLANLEQSVKQQENKQIGRTGVAPV